ncbi:MAG TPA: C45 family autoproteolytic acyltransferase/hydrolase [Kofleriaceae bacterium]|nr:C45 family autoproteolytic acyltransferase/hydrolase [Kofleriaceae bacterium]
MQRPLWLARLAGTQEQMGAQHGTLAANDAARLFEFYRTMPERALAGDGGAVIRRVVRSVAASWQTRLTRDRPAELVARSRAFVDAVIATHPGYRRDDTIRSMAVMDSLQNCVSVVARIGLGPFARPLTARVAAAAVPACSTAIAWGRATADGELLFARNFDFPGVGVWDAAPAFVVCAPDGGQRYGFFTTRGADTPVVTVVNEAGLVMAPHTRWHRNASWRGGMIVDLVHDIARRAETLDDAIRIARERPTSSTWGLAIGSARERAACVIEIAGPDVEIVRPDGDTLVCANRYRSRLAEGQLAASSAWAFQSDRRERKLRALVDAKRALTARDLAGFLGDRRDVAAPEQVRHFGGILAQPVNVHCAVVAPASRTAWVGVDRAPVCEGRWAELAWTWDGPRGAWELGGSDGSGFTATTRDDFVAPQSKATLHVHEATRLYESLHDIAGASAEVEHAIAEAPDDPSLRLAAAWLAFEAGDLARAVTHVDAGLARETEPFRRGQLLLWGSRAAKRINSPRAGQWLEELSTLTGEGIDELRSAATRRFRGRPHVNLMMADAY